MFTISVGGYQLIVQLGNSVRMRSRSGWGRGFLDKSSSVRFVRFPIISGKDVSLFHSSITISGIEFIVLCYLC